MPIRIVASCSALLAAAAVGIALVLEQWEGLAPCALCLVERWPYRIVVGLGLLALLLGGRAARILMWLAVLALAADAAVAFVHVGVEQGWWPSPLPECQAPTFAGGSIAERLASMPAHPAKPCDAPSYLWPAVPVSLALANFVFALMFTCVLAWVLAVLPAGPRRRRRR